MAAYKANGLSFVEANDSVKVLFHKSYYFNIHKTHLEKIGSFAVKPNEINFNAGDKRVSTKMRLLVENGLKAMKNIVTGRKTIFIDRNSGIPLIGNSAFGIIDRNTSIIEVKPCTGCNLDCIFCSVDEGKSSRWVNDFLIEPGYLIDGCAELAEYKGVDVEFHIGTHGEPFLYPMLLELIEGLAGLERTKTVSIDTNGTMLTKEMIDKLAKAGLTRINLSLNAFDQDIAHRLAGTSYNVDHVVKMAKYAIGKIDLLIAPLWIPGYNDKEIPKLIEFSKELGVRIGIQNFLNYKHGRNPAKQMDWDVFRKKLKEYEGRYNIKLLLDESDFGIVKIKPLPKPFRKGQVVEANVVCEGRRKGEKIVASQNRTISVPNCDKNGKIRIKITRDKHNIFYGKQLY